MGQGFDYCKHFLVVDLVVEFCRAYSLREVTHRVPGFIRSGPLRENPSHYPIRGIRFDHSLNLRVIVAENRSRGKGYTQLVKCFLTGSIEVKGDVLAHKSS